MPGHGAPVRIGILGASHWAPTTLLNPAKENTEVVVAAVASRDVSAAEPLPPNMASPGCMTATRR